MSAKELLAAAHEAFKAGDNLAGLRLITKAGREHPKDIDPTLLLLMPVLSWLVRALSLHRSIVEFDKEDAA